MLGVPIALGGGATTGVGAEGSALVRTADDGLYIVNGRSGMAIRVMQAPLKAELTDRRDIKGKPFYLSGLPEPKVSGY